MPNFWSAPVEFANIGESFVVKARPNGFRGKRYLSWIPYRTGNEFTATIEVVRVSGDSPVDVECILTEPDGKPQRAMVQTDQEVPFVESTPTRFLPITGEYVLAVNLSVVDPLDTSKRLTFNRRLISLYTFSQDAIVPRLAIGVLGAAIGAVAAFLAKT